MTENEHPFIEGVDVVFIHSQNSKLADWYRNILGLQTTYDDGHWVEFQTPDKSSRFALDMVGETASVVEKQPVVISLRVHDIHQAVVKLTERGVVFHNPQNPVFDVGPTLVASFLDPDGNWLQLSQRKI